MEWHERVSNQYLGVDESLEERSPNPSIRESIRNLRLDLSQRISILLPAMAMQLLGDKSQSKRQTKADEKGSLPQFPLVHAACSINCPLAVAAVACKTHPDQLGQKDHLMKRLPLHYAASRNGYTQQFPVGVTNNIQHMEEVSVVNFILSQFPAACRVTDGHNQLPLHIAIDQAKEEGHRRKQSWDDSCGLCTTDRAFYKPVDNILAQYPEALNRRDGKTKLYPFQQAAEGSKGDIELTFLLLRRDPAMIKPVFPFDSCMDSS
jgi:hypothetical protein